MIHQMLAIRPNAIFAKQVSLRNCRRWRCARHALIITCRAFVVVHDHEATMLSCYWLNLGVVQLLVTASLAFWCFCFSVFGHHLSPLESMSSTTGPFPGYRLVLAYPWAL